MVVMLGACYAYYIRSVFGYYVGSVLWLLC